MTTTNLRPLATCHCHAPAWAEAAEEHLRSAGRLLEVAGVSDTESARVGQIVFRLASRVRSDRLAVT